MTAIFPSLPGLGWSVVKSPRFATRIQRAVNGRELRALDQPYPLWNWPLTYPLLRDRNDTRAPPMGAGGPGIGYDELRILAGFFLQQQGAVHPFLFDDPTDDIAVAQPLGTRDSSRTVFQLLRNMGDFAEPITAPNTVSAVYFDGILQSAANYTIDAATCGPARHGRFHLLAPRPVCGRHRRIREFHAPALASSPNQAPIRLPVIALVPPLRSG